MGYVTKITCFEFNYMVGVWCVTETNASDDDLVMRDELGDENGDSQAGEDALPSGTAVLQDYPTQTAGTSGAGINSDRA